MATTGSVVRIYPKDTHLSQVVFGWVSRLLSERRKRKESDKRRKEVARLRREAAAVLERETERLYEWLIEMKCDETTAAHFTTSCGARELRQWAIDGLVDRRKALLDAIELMEDHSSERTSMLLVTKNSPGAVRLETKVKNGLLRVADAATFDFLQFWDHVTSGIEGKSFGILQGSPWDDADAFLGRKIDRVLTTLPLAS